MLKIMNTIKIKGNVYIYDNLNLNSTHTFRDRKGNQYILKNNNNQVKVLSKNGLITTWNEILLRD